MTLINPSLGNRRSFSSFNKLFFSMLTSGKDSCHYESAEKVVFVFVDAFGSRFFQRFCDKDPLLARIMREGTHEECYSQFPSTTACHTTTIHFGLPVSESGIFEWNYYEPEVGELISPLLFSFTGDHERNSLSRAGFTTSQIFPFVSFYRQLRQKGIPSFVFQNKNYTPSPFSDAAFEGASVYPYSSESQGIEELAQCISSVEGKGYFFLYLDSFDSATHKYGPDSMESDAALLEILNLLNHRLVEAIPDQGGRLALFISADHGQVEIDPAKTVFIDHEFPESAEWFSQGAAGLPLVPGGSSRDLFLYINDERVEEVQTLLAAKLSGIAEVRLVSDLIQQNVFGVGPISDRLRGRLSNLVVLPYGGQSVWWSGGGSFVQNFRGHHGGLTKEEMEIPLLGLRL